MLSRESLLCRDQFSNSCVSLGRCRKSYACSISSGARIPIFKSTMNSIDNMLRILLSEQCSGDMLGPFVDLCCVGILVGDMYASMQIVFQNDTCIDMSKYVYMYTHVYIYIYICIYMLFTCVYVWYLLASYFFGIAGKCWRHCR